MGKLIRIFLPLLWECKQSCASPWKLLSAPSCCRFLSCFARRRMELLGFYKTASQLWNREGKTPLWEPSHGKRYPPCATHIQPLLFLGDFLLPPYRNECMEIKHYNVLLSLQNHKTQLQGTNFSVILMSKV